MRIGNKYELGLGTYLSLSPLPFSTIEGGRALCADGKARALRHVGEPTAPGEWPAQIYYGHTSVAGTVTSVCGILVFQASREVGRLAEPARLDPARDKETRWVGLSLKSCCADLVRDATPRILREQVQFIYSGTYVTTALELQMLIESYSESWADSGADPGLAAQHARYFYRNCRLYQPRRLRGRNTWINPQARRVHQQFSQRGQPLHWIPYSDFFAEWEATSLQLEPSFAAEVRV